MEIPKTTKLIWPKIPETEKDPVLDAYYDYLKDSRKGKVNLTIGVYRDENLKPFVIEPIKELMKEIISNDDTSIFDESPSRCDNTVSDLLINEFFDEKNEDYKKAVAENRVSRTPVQSGGNGLYFLIKLWKQNNQKYATNETDRPPHAWVSDPTWPIHNQILAYHGVPVMTYQYYDKEARTLSFDRMIEDLIKMKKGDMLLLQNCGHNPTGFDPSFEQWEILSNLIIEKQVFVLFDFAYMGFATGNIQKDAFSLTLFLKKNIEFGMTFSCSKNFGLYSLKVGFILAINNDSNKTKDTDDLFERSKLIMYDKPTSFGPSLVRFILSDKHRRSKWHESFQTMNNRLFSMRVKLRDTIHALGNPNNWSFLTEQSGMFSYTGLKVYEIDKLLKEYAIFLLRSGRISIAGLNEENVERVAKAFHEVTKNRNKL